MAKVIRVLNDDTEGYAAMDDYTYHIVHDSYVDIGEEVFQGSYIGCREYVEDLAFESVDMKFIGDKLTSYYLAEDVYIDSEMFNKICRIVAEEVDRMIIQKADEVFDILMKGDYENEKINNKNIKRY